MTNQQIGYDIYVEKCISYGIEPLNFKQFIGKLSHEQLESYANYAQQDEQ
jgi:hypothetical protein